ncbi:MAG TPA: MliC family protein [Geminicoccus sp.]|jgi:membrane-bound inhibitor of C-type lysozyme|uniref:MliC family protein n=1 Tax=Geminicoccus sp. TaxID=2024832 RepID=UPI002E2F52BF|nr:MliC family protein [Geminicoccus sp.]HEX2528311.1 MliC family protein [Geminicoccus sp.]
MRPAVLAVAGTLALAACGGKIEGPNRHVPPSGTTVTYDCDNGKVLRATYEGLSDVHIITEGKDVVLHSVMSERGAKYKQSADEFWMEGSEATFQTVDGTTDCIIRP